MDGFEYFSIVVHHGGAFVYIPERCIVWEILTILTSFTQTFSVIEVNLMVTELGYNGIMIYNYLVPEMTVDDGLRMLGGDSDCREMSTYTQNHRLIHVYIEHGQTTIVDYYMKTVMCLLK